MSLDQLPDDVLHLLGRHHLVNEPALTLRCICIQMRDRLELVWQEAAALPVYTFWLVREILCHVMDQASPLTFAELYQLVITSCVRLEGGPWPSSMSIPLDGLTDRLANVNQNQHGERHPRLQDLIFSFDLRLVEQPERVFGTWTGRLEAPRGSIYLRDPNCQVPLSPMDWKAEGHDDRYVMLSVSVCNACTGTVAMLCRTEISYEGESFDAAEFADEIEDAIDQGAMVCSSFMLHAAMDGATMPGHLDHATGTPATLTLNYDFVRYRNDADNADWTSVTHTVSRTLTDAELHALCLLRIMA